MNRKFPLVIILLVFVAACTKENDNSEFESDVPVVESLIEPGNEIKVALSKMLPFTDEEYTESLVIDDADLFIKYNDQDFPMLPLEDGSGEYVCLDSNLIAVVGGNYELYFEYNDIIVRSSTSIPSPPIDCELSSSSLQVDPEVMGPGSSVDPMSISWNNSENDYHLIVLEYLESSYNPISENLDSDNYDTFRRVSTDPILGESYDLNTRQHLVFFGSYRAIVYKVNEEYVNLYENISQSSLNLTEPLTNVENGLGIFTGLNSYTLYLEVVEI